MASFALDIFTALAPAVVVFLLGYVAYRRVSISRGKAISWVFFVLNLLVTAGMAFVMILGSALGSVFGGDWRNILAVLVGISAIVIFFIQLVYLFKIKRLLLKKVIRAHLITLSIASVLFVMLLVIFVLHETFFL